MLKMVFIQNEKINFLSLMKKLFIVCYRIILSMLIFQFLCKIFEYYLKYFYFLKCYIVIEIFLIVYYIKYYKYIYLGNEIL